MKNLIKFFSTISVLSVVVISTSNTFASQSINISATLTNQCSVTNTPTLAFGSGSLSSIANAVGGVTVTCAASTPVSWTINGGNNYNSTTSTRAMIDGTGNNKLNYNVYSDLAHAAVITPGTSYPAGTADSTGTTFNVYAQINLNQPVVATSYTDTLTVILQY